MIANPLALAARVLMSSIFLWSAFGKLQAPGGTIDYIASSGLPLPELAFGAALVVELVGAVMILLGIAVRPAAVALALFCLATAALFHNRVSDENELIHALKNVALAGGLLQLAAFGPGEWRVRARPAPLPAQA